MEDTKPVKNCQIKIISSLCALLFLLFFACSKGVPKFNSYDEAVSWYEQQQLEEISPESTSIYKAKYHSAHGVLIVYFMSRPTKGYIHSGFSEKKWNEFKAAPSKGHFYNASIKDRYRYKLKKE